ncbi:MAG: transposase, partial [Alphaproteobacteria bacterium]|nr:transposase [Alphaproteobacteria bacterium]
MGVVVPAPGDRPARLHAYAVVSKCADALPLHCISKRFARGGVNIARSTLTDLFHRTASLLA